MARFLWYAAAGLALAGCAGLAPSDPLDEVPRLSDLNISDTAGEVRIAAPEDQSGFFAGLFGRGAADASTSTREDAVDAPLTQAVAPAAAPTTEQRSGLFVRMFGRSADTDAPDTPPVPADDVTAATSPPDTATPQPTRNGLLARFSVGRDAPAAAEPQPGTVPPGTPLPFGEVARTCGMPASALGTKIYAASGYTIYDSAANTTAPRPHYVTGFADGCARQFTAALVLNGDVGTHEVVRYQTAQSKERYTAVDNAYETLKAQICGAGRGQPCGRQIDRLARNTTFITGYARFASSPTWVEMLLHNGEVIAVGVESK